MSSANKKIIVVTGATGAQGGALARAILSDKNSEFKVRALTRDPTSDKAKALAAAGAEVVKGDVHDAAAVAEALKGAYGLFAVTFFWHHMNPETELAEARVLAEESKKAGIEHVVWSTLEDTRPFFGPDNKSLPKLNGDYYVPHFDVKGFADSFFKGLPTTYLWTSFYYENLIHFGAGPKRQADGKLHFVLPMGDRKLAAISSEDIGKCAYGVFKAGKQYVDKHIGIAGDSLTVKEWADELGKALGEPVIGDAPTTEQYRHFGFPGAEELGNMFQFKYEFNKEFLEHRDLELSRKLNPDLQSFATWLKTNAKKIPL